MRLVLVACVFALALGACDGSSSQTGSTTSTTTGSTGTPAGPCPTFHGTTARAASVGPRPIGFLTDATAGVAGCLDQVMFSFRSLGNGTPPGYVVEYKDPPFSDGDPPREFSLDGAAFLSVTIAPAASFDVTQEDHPRTYFGNLLLQYDDHHHLVLVRKFDDALGTVRWVIALDGKRPFVVDSAADPTRITVYIG
ncbi:MAG: hypothetical protein WD271_16655 [Acidimicrobiia bacterium]